MSLPEAVEVKCEEFTSRNSFYSGKAVRAYALKTPKGLLLLVINQNPVKNVKCTVVLPKGKAFELVTLRELTGTEDLDLEPGGAACIYCGGDPGELEKRLAAGQAGRVLGDLEATRRILDDVEFRLCCALDIAVSEEMRRNTKRYARWPPHPDKEFEKIRRDLAACFAGFYRISDAVETGGGFKAAEGLGRLRQAAGKAAEAAKAWLAKHPRKDLIDDPCAD